jgi:hypothetical protein
MPAKSKPTTPADVPDEDIDAATSQLMAWMQGKLQAAGMDASPDAVRAACRRKLKAAMVLKGTDR